MNKKPLLFSFLALLSTGCIERSSTPIQETRFPTKTITQSTVSVTSQSIYTSEPTTILSPNSQNIRYYTLKTIQGSTVKLGVKTTGFLFPQYQGRVILLNIFGKNCPHCLNEMPIIQYLQNRYQGSFQVIAIQAEESMSQFEAQNLIQRYNIQYPIIEGEDTSDLFQSIKKNYEWMGSLPLMLMIKDGVTEFTYHGEVSQADMETDLQSLL